MSNPYVLLASKTMEAYGRISAGISQKEELATQADMIDQSIQERIRNNLLNNYLTFQEGRKVKGRILTQAGGQGKGAASGGNLLALRDVTKGVERMVDASNREVNYQIGQMAFQSTYMREKSKGAMFNAILGVIGLGLDSYSSIDKAFTVNKDTKETTSEASPASFNFNPSENPYVSSFGFDDYSFGV